MEIAMGIYLIMVLGLIGLYFLGQYFIKVRSKFIFKGAKTIEWKLSRQLDAEWEKEHPILEFFINCHYEIKHILKKPTEMYRESKWFLQRGKKGYSDCDVWNFDFYLARVIVNGLKELKGQLHGVPSEFGSDDGEEIDMGGWKACIDDIIYAFEIELKIGDHEVFYIPKKKQTKRVLKWAEECNIHILTKEERERYNKGWRLFKKYFQNLWD